VYVGEMLGLGRFGGLGRSGMCGNDGFYLEYGHQAWATHCGYNA